MKRIGKLWDYVTDKINILIAFRKARKGKSTRECVKVIERDLDFYLSEVQYMLKDHNFTTSTYKQKTIREPKKRTIFILPFFPDRIIQHALMNICEPILENLMYYHSYACIPGKGIHPASLLTKQYVSTNNYVLKCDVSKFYPSINHDVVMDVLENVFKDPNILWLFEDIVYSIDGRKNLPIGNYVSQWMGNLYLDGLDHFIKDTLRIKNYVRYCDDFILFDKNRERLEQAAVELQQYLIEYRGLTLSKCMIFPSKIGVDFLGYRYFPEDKVLVRKTTAKRMKHRLAELYYIFRHKLDTCEHINQSLQSILGWLRWANTRNFTVATDLYKLENLVYERSITEDLFDVLKIKRESKYAHDQYERWKRYDLR